MKIESIDEVYHDEEYSSVTITLEGMDVPLEVEVSCEIKVGQEVRIDFDNNKLYYGESSCEYWDII